MPVRNLYPLSEAADSLGGISIWTIRKHVARGSIAVVRIGKRVFLRSEEIERIREEGLPSLRGNVGSVSHSEVEPNSNTRENGCEPDARATR